MPRRSRRPRRPARVLGGLGAVCALLWAWLAAPAGAHPHNSAPPVDLTLTWASDGLSAVVDVEKYQLASWLPQAPRFVDLDAAIPDEVALARLLTRLEVQLDGAPVAPLLRSQSDGGGFDPQNQPRLKLLLHYPSTRPPASVRVVWKEFVGIFWETGPQVPLVVEVGAQVDSATLTPEEPEFTWRARPPAAFRSTPAPLPPAPTGERLPWPALGLAALALALPFVGPWRRSSRGRRLLPSAAALSLAVGAWLLGGGSPAAPWGRAQPPSSAQAQRIFHTLLNSVYRSFDAQSETQIYDLLAASVERTLLKDLYGEVYESLVMREKGAGAVCRVEEVTPGETSVAFPENGSTMQFDAEAAWTVKGAVNHWGHTHRRVNLYKARVTVRNDGSSWRIAAVEMLEHKRIDDGTLRPQ